MNNSLGDRLRLAFLRKIVLMVTFAITVGCVLSLFYLSEQYHLRVLNWLGVALFLLGLFIMVFTLPEIFARMEGEGTLLFGPAIAHTLYGYAAKLSFLPLIGPTLERFFFRKKEKNPFVIEHEKKE